MTKDDLKPILDLLTDWLLDADQELISGSEREKKALIGDLLIRALS